MDGQKKDGLERPQSFDEAVERIREKVEAPVLSPAQAALWRSGYLKGFGEALALLEQARQDKNEIVPGISDEM
ncbi:hypothetical protein [Desulfofundulus thermosubterraneus]|uniref:Uncharacterized protein n=1 Tax=Desulfofundulus thermosubterraneus DSM 16057 TaxID=1121432 RepID=A0A1M6J118_9FIRM|nr:hypothetical protein [Desulfofundulus thermosubterraneus]SHJ40319.1 hypothetical protein SAMN02745219_02479 [Desulfofundulus thermosubterraneus DSM 16057]